jgi:hypothetical protein
LVGYAVATGLRPAGAVVAAALGIALGFDSALSGRHVAAQYVAAAAALVGAVIVSAVWASPMEFATLTYAATAVLAVSAVAGLFTPVGRVVSRGDITGRPLQAPRIRIARVATVALVIVYAGVGGTTGMTTVGPAAAALLALPPAWAYRRSRWAMPASTE